MCRSTHLTESGFFSNVKSQPDADFNLGLAFGALATLHVPGVWIAMSGWVYEYDQVG